MSSIKLTDITRGMHHAASTTSAMISQQYMEMLNQFFDYDDDGHLHAKMVSVEVSNGHYIRVPLVALAAPKGIALEGMKIRMALRIDETESVKGTHEDDNSEATRGSFKVSVAPSSERSRKRKSDIVDIEMEFKATDPPEGVMRLIDSYTNMIMPERLDDTGMAAKGHFVKVGNPLTRPEKPDTGE
ncbi:MAG: DUF2589 domain-containing protein [bacterium]|nr:DUF2589 domain-containing protein [bacterium]